MCASATPYVFGLHVDGIALVTSVFALALIGAILTLMARDAGAAQGELASERAAGEAALRIAERVRGSLELDEVLAVAVEELGRATRASRCRLRVDEPGEIGGPLYHWQRSDLEPLDFEDAPALAARVLRTGKRVVVPDKRLVNDELRAYVERFGAESYIGYPVEWRGRTLAVLGLFDDRPRDWARDTLPLLERVLPQVAAAIAQAEVYRQQQEALARLEELARLRQHLVANVSHELRTPLTSTIGFLQTLERPDIELSPEQRTEFVRIAREQAQRLATLVDDLLELARLDRGTLPLEPQPTEVAAIASRAAGEIPIAPGRAVRLEIPPGLVAWADPQRLLQVLQNLITNAIRHGGGAVVVSGERIGVRVEIAVTDEGQGVPPERVSELFVPFARWSDAEGTGLGLAISRNIAEAHGGSLVYRPALDGRQHAFVVSLPAVND